MTQEWADYLITTPKIASKDYKFPTNDDYLTIEVFEENGSEKFLVDINRKGTYRLRKCTYLERYQVSQLLIRLDICENKPHRNPDDSVIVGNHVHVYREGYDMRWAYLLKDPLDRGLFKNVTDLVATFYDFCAYCNIRFNGTIQGCVL